MKPSLWFFGGEIEEDKINVIEVRGLSSTHRELSDDQPQHRGEEETEKPEESRENEDDDLHRVGGDREEKQRQGGTIRSEGTTEK